MAGRGAGRVGVRRECARQQGSRSVADGTCVHGRACAQVAAAIAARSMGLRRLSAVLRTVGADSLAAIGEAWESGQLAPLRADEVQALVLALSEDSAGRRGLLAKLAAGV